MTRKRIHLLICARIDYFMFLLMQDNLKSKDLRLLDVDALVLMLHEKVSMTCRSECNLSSCSVDAGVDQGEGTGLQQCTRH